ncbi:cobalamin-binding protein [Halocatena salina]|uniref:Cobalamin-binding protein n=1 Tax=Halocatena salina TaxID=2934340 RepID=A0A8U0A0H0_9EURY|nr:cobalamin-binding protein [Halocatena salina]UPM42346.1 cobalamin-binding protein [Halocatena salina]
MRVVTLLPSATEIVYALGISPVAVSHECDHPPAARSKPVVNHARIDATASSAVIDQQVLQAERNGGVYEIDLDVLAAADPDLIVTQGLCDVCAVDQVLVEEAVSELDLDCEILTTDPHSLGDIRSDIERIGGAVGRSERAVEVIEAFDSRIESVRDAVTEIDERPQVVVLDWLDPLMTAGHWVPEMVSIAGGRTPFDAEASIPREWDEIRAVDPDVLVVAPCGFDLEQTAENSTDLTEREGWSELTAVAAGRVYAIDGHEHMNRPGVRIAESLEQLAGVIHPQRIGPPSKEAARSFDRLIEQ